MAGSATPRSRIAEVVELDMQVEDGKVKTYRARVKVSFKYQSED